MTSTFSTFSNMRSCRLLLSIPAAKATLIQIPQPDAAYTSSTTLLPITGKTGIQRARSPIPT